MDATALDPANDPENRQPDAYVGKYYFQTVGGSATHLFQFPSGSQSLVVSHQLLSHLNLNDRIAVLKESFRVLAPGATARHSIVIPGIQNFYNVDTGSTEFHASLQLALQDLIGPVVADSACELAVFIDQPRLKLARSPGTVPMESLVDSELFRDVSYDDLRASVAPLEKRALALLIVLRRSETATPPASQPSTGWLSWIFG